MKFPDTHIKSEVEVSIAGTTLGGNFTIQEVSVRHAANRIPSARIAISDGSSANQTFSLSASQKPKLEPGAKVSITIKDPASGFAYPCFSGILVAHQIRIRNKRSQLILDCQDPAVKMALGIRTRCFTDQNDSQALTQIITDHGLTAKVKHTQIKLPALVQYEASDWEFTLLRARLNGYIAIVHAGTISLNPPDYSNRSKSRFEYGVNVIEAQLEIDGRTQLGEVEAKSWSIPQQNITVQKSKSAKPKAPQGQGNFKGEEIAKGLGNPQVQLGHPGSLKAPQLKAWAESNLTKSRMEKIQGWVKTYGCQVEVGETITLGGLGDRFNGEVYITGVHHRLELGEWTTTLTFGLARIMEGLAGSSTLPSPLFSHTPVSGLSIGKVTQIADDPASEYQIRVRISLFEEDAQIWARMAFPDAGGDRGVVFFPEPGDEVLLGFLGGDPAFPTILGSLFSSKGKPPISPEAKNNEKGIFTRSGLKLQIDDEKKAITLQTPSGYLFNMDESVKKLLFKDNSGNALIFSTSGIKLQASKNIEIVSAGNINLKGTRGISLASDAKLQATGLNIDMDAKMKFTASGKSMAQLESSGITTVKGTLVKIN